MKNKPNLLLFMPETIRADAVIGDPDFRAKTPNLDRFVSESTVFTNAFAQMAFCTPSRCSMFTGLYPHSNGHRSIWHLLQRHERNLLQDLKEAGYYTAVCGRKNDLIDFSAVDQCIDELELTVNTEVHNGETEPIPSDSPLKKLFYKGKRIGNSNDPDWASIQSAMKFLEREHPQPWCLLLPMRFAHPPYLVEEPYFSLHDRQQLPSPIPEEISGKRIYKKALHELYNSDNPNEEIFREIKGTYYGMISRVDTQFGQVLDKLKEFGQEENTVVVYFSDHGDYAGDYGLVEKYFAGFEDCMLNVPLIIRAPGMKSGARNCLCEMIDLYPTLLELAGVKSKHFHFGRSLIPAISNEQINHREAVFAEGGYLENEKSFQIKINNPDGFTRQRLGLYEKYPNMGSRAVMMRTEKFKYVYAPHDCDELYNLSDDPNELQNLAELPEYDTTVKEMRDQIMLWLLDTSDTLPLEQGGRGW